MSTVTPLIGRERELAQLTLLVDAASVGEVAVAFVDGEAGSGKTRLLDELAARISALGGLVIRGTAPPPAGAPLPFAAITQVLRDTLHGLSNDERERIVESTVELGHLLPAWRTSTATPPPGTTLTILCSRFAELVDHVARDRPVIGVLLDDLQWADSATLDLLSFLLRSPRETRVLLGLAARLDELSPDAPLHRLRAEILRQGAAAVRLGPLAAEEVQAYLQALGASALPPATLARIVDLGRGNPLFLAELATAGEASGSLPETIRELMRNRLALVGDGERAVLSIMALAGDTPSSELVVMAAGGPPEATEAALRRLIEGHLLEPKDMTIRMSLPAMREVILDELLDGERRRLHGAIARALAADSRLDPAPEAERLLRLAHHWDQAGDGIRTFPALVRAAEAAERSFAFATSFALYRSALNELSPDTPGAGDRGLGFQPPAAETATSDLRLRAAEAAVLAGQPAVALGWLDAALRDVSVPDERHRLALARARALLATGDAVAAVDAYSNAIDDRGPYGPPASGRVGLSRALTAAGQPTEAVAVAERALAESRAMRSKTEEEAALLALGTALANAGDMQAGMRHLQDARALHAAPTTESALRPRVSRVIDLTAGWTDAARLVYSAGLVDEGAMLAGEAATAAARWGAEGQVARGQLVEAAADVDRGAWDRALAVLDRLAGDATSGITPLALRARIGAWRGAWERAAADLARCEGISLVRGQPEDRAAFAVALVELRLARRESAAAIDAATEGLLQVEGASVTDQLDVVQVATRAHVEQALAAEAVRSPAEASTHLDLARALVHQSERLGGTSVQPRAVALRASARAELARLDGDGARAWTEARAAWESVPSVWSRAYAGFREAEASLAGSGTRQRARDVLIGARVLATELEAAPLLAEIEALARRARISFPVREAESSPAKPDPQLPISQREMEVLVLIARGLTNREIAAELFISERTAAHHVSHIFDKLGVSSRVEAAGMAHQAGVIAAGSAP